MSSKVIIEETIGKRAFRLSAAQHLGIAQFAVMLGDRGMVQMDRVEAEFLARALRVALDAMPADVREETLPQTPQTPPAPEKPPEPPARAGKRWDPEEDAKLVDVFKNGVDYRTIAKEFGRTPTAIIERLLFHKLVTVMPTEQARVSA